MTILLKTKDGCKRFFQNQDQVIDYLEIKGTVKTLEKNDSVEQPGEDDKFTCPICGAKHRNHYRHKEHVKTCFK